MTIYNDKKNGWCVYNALYYIYVRTSYASTDCPLHMLYVEKDILNRSVCVPSWWRFCHNIASDRMVLRASMHFASVDSISVTADDCVLDSCLTGVDSARNAWHALVAIRRWASRTLSERFLFCSVLFSLRVHRRQPFRVLYSLLSYPSLFTSVVCASDLSRNVSVSSVVGFSLSLMDDKRTEQNRNIYYIYEKLHGLSIK